MARSDISHISMWVDLGHERDEIPERVMGARGLRHLVMWLRLDGMHQVGELHGVLDEKNRHVVADQIPVAFVGIELHCEPAHSRAVSLEPRSPATVEKRTNTGVILPASWKGAARVSSVSGS